MKSALVIRSLIEIKRAFVRFLTRIIGTRLTETVKIANIRPQIKMMLTEDLIVR